ncbi:hypothetical protein F5Y12DRAFT_784703 [Xylaria sp. FL1777]|nr:hypothetical protein F5Y12DRAFT_784703 [Xylaria sp. FL1777]
MERILNELLRHRGLEITSKFAPKNPELTTLVEKFRLQISRYFCEVALSEPSNTSTVQRSPHGRKEDQKSEIEAQVTFQNQRISRLMKRVREVDLLVLFNWITRTFKNPTLDCLARDIRRALYFDDLFNKRDICHQIKRNISTNTPMARIELDWKPFEFFESQFRGIIPDIGSLVTLTGSALYAHATTCKSYLQSTWPRTWEPFLVALQSAMEAEARPFAPFQHTSDTPFSHIIVVMDSDIIKFQFMPDQTLSVLIGGKMETIIDVAQQISWLSAALSLSPFEQKVAYCNARLVCSPSHTGKPRFKVERVFAQPQSIEESCWLPLFSNAALVWGFPIPARGGEIGLEISIDLLAAIAGVRHAAEYDGGIVMKGFSCMLIPIKLDTIADTVQWHLVSSQDEATRLSYQEGIARCPNRALLSDLDLQTLLTTRAILGWCSTVETVLGGNDINYDNIFYSTAQDAKKPVKLQNLAVGFQQFGTAQMEFTLGPKDGTCHFQRQGPYRKIVNAAEITPIVLFDTGERRGWLVPASGVLLHIIQHRNWLDGLSSKGWLSLKQGTSFREVLLQNESMALFDEENYEFKHMIADIWSILEFLLDQRVSASNDPGLTVKSPFQEIIQGYEFKAIVEDRSPLKLKQFRVEKTSGGWPSLVRDIDALVLFADGFENLIQPVQGDHGLCHMWKTVPKDKDYLATTVKMLNELYDVAGCRLDKQYLTSSRLQLDRGHSILFEACNKVSAWQCKCNRLLQIVPKKSFGVVPPGPLQEEGGIIFGQSSTLLNDCRKPTPSAPREISIYSQPNKTFNSVDDALVEDKESASCFWEHSTDAALPSIPTRPSTDTNESPLPYQDSPGEESEDLDVGNYLRPSKKRGYDPELKTDGERLRRVDVSINGSKSDIKAAGCQEAQA